MARSVSSAACTAAPRAYALVCFGLRDLSYRLRQDRQLLEYRMVIWSNDPERVGALEQRLLALPEVVHFRIAPSRD